ncbi:hypothetical protein ACI6QG_06860 [Roseococcus sp. DSY-14]|uniref:hypothetical protein n=1 Tax=Roseococcus sp. DSY-14 TaxID=3369650 RepID=UPI00387B02FA
MRRALLLALALAGCAEMRTPAPPPADPALTGGVAPFPGPAVAALALRDFDRAGAALEGRPAAAALAAARLEWLALALGPAGELAAMPDSVRFAMARALEEVRAALAIHPASGGTPAIAALLEASRRLERGEEPALGPPVFRDVQPNARQRLEQPGPLPNAALVTGGIVEELGRGRREADVGIRP